MVASASVRVAKGRNWRCPECGFQGHRDVVGGVNMHPLAFG
ncbi:zinc ribbon domain-containing protein [Acidithiobacillus caldus]